MSEKIVGVPTVKGMGSSLKDFGVGSIAGLLFLLIYKLFGGLGLIAAPLIAGTMIKGERSQIVVTMAGFMLFAMALFSTSSSSSSSDSGTM